MMPPPLPTPLALASDAFLAGLLVALALLALLAYRALHDRVVSGAGLFGLLAAGAWLGYSGLARAALPAAWAPALPAATTVVSAACLVVWERVAAGLLTEGLPPRRATAIRWVTGLGALMVAVTTTLPWAGRPVAETILGLLGPFLALHALLHGLKAPRRRGRPATPLALAALALLLCSAGLWSERLGWVPPAANLRFLQVSLAGLALSLGWAVLNRMTDLRRIVERAQADQLSLAALHARELEDQVAQRNLELSERLRELEDARRSAERANAGLQKALEQVEAAASTDRLTGAWNRRRFEEMVVPELALARRRREPISVLMMDLDHFKRVNDTFGHAAGDAVLAGVAQTLRRHLRASDALVRWGGEEFLLLTPATRLAGASGLADKLRIAVGQLDFPGIGQVTLSAGVAEYGAGETLETWIDRADQALYQAKRQGRNRVVSAEMPECPEADDVPEHPLLEVVWEPAYACGNRLIDTQHERLFLLANALLAVLTEERPLPEIALRLETLLAHTAQHFHDEEALLRAARYPDLPEHMGIHGALLLRARDLQSDVSAGRLDFGRLFTFLALDLVKGHILTEDRNYFAHLVQSLGEAGVPPAGA